ncbi:MAG TPA: hypothetical protein VGI19_13950, partial [Candidatus Cybelea sp.]
EWTAQEIKEYLQAQHRPPVIYFVALARQPLGLQNPPHDVTIVTLRSPSSFQNAFFEWYAAQQNASRLRGAFPPMSDPDVMGAQTNPSFVEIDVALAELVQKFVIVTPLDPIESYWLA